MTGLCLSTSTFVYDHTEEWWVKPNKLTNCFMSLHSCYQTFQQRKMFEFVELHAAKSWGWFFAIILIFLKRKMLSILAKTYFIAFLGRQFVLDPFFNWLNKFKLNKNVHIKHYSSFHHNFNKFFKLCELTSLLESSSMTPSSSQLCHPVPLLPHHR